MNRVSAPIKLALLCIVALVSTGCISTGETIRVSGQVVDVDGQPIANSNLIATASKRGGTLTHPGEIEQADTEDEAREATVYQQGDGRFTAEAHWSGALTLSVEGYKIRRVDDLGTEFLVPNRTFFKSQEQVRLEVVKDE
jgi:hypothetical protein